ncbi:MAG: hypothetical protein B6242_05945 [Anaerolineaceae bacterium 4572_78]|nr:MAG: hypothetical protein B6242_05945 [Anaerolineaceae bacterium 4572_78]
MITSTKNPKIIAIRKLSQRKHRQAQNRFAIEGLQLISMALAQRHQPLDVFYSESHFKGKTAPKLLSKLAQAGGQLHAISPHVMQALSERESPQGIIVTLPIFSEKITKVLSSTDHPSLIIIADRLQDPGNLGTIIRTADSISATAIVLIEPCVDPFDLKTVRGSMGSLFAIPLIHTTKHVSLFTILQKANYTITGADGQHGKLAWHENILHGSIALVLGNEARGLSHDVRSCITNWVRLPLLGQAESLNVAVAGGVLMYQWLQKNMGG